MKGYKYLFLLLLISAWTSVRAESYPVSDPDYIYLKIEKGINKQELPQDTLQVLPPSEIEEVSTFEVTEEEEEIQEEPTEISENIQLGKIEEFKRDIESVVFVPKGQWIFGLSVSYTQSSQDKYQFLILEGISGDTYSFKISPMVMFAVKADLALGGRFSYARSLTKVSNADIVLDSETNYTFDHLYRLSHNYYGAALMRNYFSIGKSKRFGFFNEVSLQMGGGQTKLTTGVGEDLTGTYERNFSLNVGITPGLSIFLNNYSALEVNVGLLGFNYTNTRAVKDQVYVSTRNSKSANFRINLFSITFGATFYL